MVPTGCGVCETHQVSQGQLGPPPVDGPAEACEAPPSPDEVTVAEQELPEAFQRAREADEPFWQGQEKRIQGAVGQPCCTLSGLSTGLIGMDGNFAVVIHGEHECAACFLHYGPSAHRFFCTGLEEKHFVTGETSGRLNRCLRLVAEEVTPDAIFVLGACPVEVIGDRFEAVVAKVQEDYPHIPMRALHTSGLKVGSQAAMTDWLYSTLASLPTRAPLDPTWRDRVGELGMDLVDAFLELDPDQLLARYKAATEAAAPRQLDRERCVAFLGMPSAADLGGYKPEWLEVLTDAGLHVTGNYPYAANLEDWRAITWPRVSFVADRTNYPKTIALLEEAGQRVVEVPLPVGVAQTDEFYQVLGEATGRSEQIVAAVAERRAAAVQSIEDFKARYGGKRMAMGLRMLNNYKTDQLAYQGLGDYGALQELGFQITLMVQGPPEKAPKFAKLFESRGVTDPFEVFPEPWNLSEHLGGDRFDISYLADHCRAEARKAGVPMIVSRLLYPGYEGVPRNTRAIAAHLDKLT